MNLLQYRARFATSCTLKERRWRHVGLSFTAQNACAPPKKYAIMGFFLILKRSPFGFGGKKMKMIVDGKYLESEDDENETCDYWDIEDRLYEQYKEMKIEGD